MLQEYRVFSAILAQTVWAFMLYVVQKFYLLQLRQNLLIRPENTSVQRIRSESDMHPEDNHDTKPEQKEYSLYPFTSFRKYSAGKILVSIFFDEEKIPKNVLPLP